MLTGIVVLGGEKRYMNQKNYEYTKGWIAYFDILGFSNIVENLPLPGVLNRYHEVLRRLGVNQILVEPKWFSDTFLLHKEEKEDGPEGSFSQIEDSSRRFFTSMLRFKPTPLRGCLCYGDYYVDQEKDIYIGPAIIDAYRLAEKQNWIGYILAPSAVESIRSFGVTKEHTIKKYYLEYDVPCKNQETKKLLACKMNISDNLQENLGWIRRSLDSIESVAKIHISKRYDGDTEKIKLEFEKVKVKCQNTRDFISTIENTTKNN